MREKDLFLGFIQLQLSREKQEKDLFSVDTNFGFIQLQLCRKIAKKGLFSSVTLGFIQLQLCRKKQKGLCARGVMNLGFIVSIQS